MNKMILVLIIFTLTYIFMLSFPKKRALIAFFVALLFILIKVISFNNAIKEIDFNILLMIVGTMGTVSLFIESKMPALLADLIIKKSANTKIMTIFLVIFAGIISAFVDNVATVLMIAPVALVLAKKLKISPVPILISISIFSNLEGAATLVGDTTSILLAGANKMNFLDFFFYNGHIGLFFIVQFSLITATITLAYLLKNKKEKIVYSLTTKVNDYVPTFLLIDTIITLILVSFSYNKPVMTNGIVCIFYFIVGIIYSLIKDHSFINIKNCIKDIDFQTIILLASLFVIIGGVKEAGVITSISNLFINISNNNLFFMFTLIVFVSVIVSGFVDNIPYVATMLPVIASVSLTGGVNSTVLYYGLIIGATLGGNITPIGASANIASIGILNKNGYEVSNKEFFHYSIPITIVAVLTGYITILLLFKF